MYEHFADSLSEPRLVHVDNNLVCIRFETMKVISALGAVKHLLDTGIVRPGDTLLDSSSGIYAYALALACHRYGMRCHIVGSTSVDSTLRTQLEILGATLEQTPPSQSLKLDQSIRVRRIREILGDNPTYHWMRQYHDDIHYGGYRAVAELIRRETEFDELTLVGGVGTGASTGAMATFLREHGTSVHLVGVQPFGSVTFGSENVADPEIIIAGIGSSIPFDNVRHHLYDTIHWVGFEAAFSASVGLLRKHAIFAGLSTGAAYLAARWEREQSNHRIALFIAPDTGHRYTDSVFSKHRNAVDIDSFGPQAVSTLDDLSLPWSVMHWNQADAPNTVSANTKEGTHEYREPVPRIRSAH